MIIYLMGMMGAGKTTLGKHLAEYLNYRFIDLDNVIEKNTSQSIQEIFETFGENYFRNLESDALKSITGKNLVVSLGGGTPCFNDNIKFIKENGTSIFLDNKIENLVKNLLEDEEKRPLIQNKSKEEATLFLKELYEERKPIYNQAEYTIHANWKELKNLADQLK